jgi:hypothetical protein
LAKRSENDTTSFVVSIIAMAVLAITIVIVAIGAVALLIVAAVVVVHLGVKAWRWWRNRPASSITPTVVTAYGCQPSREAPAAEESDWRAYAFPATAKLGSPDECNDPLAKWKEANDVGDLVDSTMGVTRGRTMNPASIEFLYRAPGQEAKIFELFPGWKEVGCYIEGIDAAANKLKTFRKDRVVEYLGGAEALLDDPFCAPPPKPVKHHDDRPELLFTGFPSVQRANLERIADEAGFKVVQSVTQHLAYLCAGPNAGPAKVGASRAQGVFIVSEPQFRQLSETGELPDDDDRIV